jgi:hypothetical protein
VRLDHLLSKENHTSKSKRWKEVSFKKANSHSTKNREMGDDHSKEWLFSFAPALLFQMTEVTQ